MRPKRCPFETVNFTRDAPSALHAIRNWPTKVIFVGREVGSVPSGLKIGARFDRLPDDHPVRVAYELYFGGKTRDRHVADPVTVLYAVRGLGERWTLVKDGAMELQSNMTFMWRLDFDLRQGYLRKRWGMDSLIEGELESLLGLQPD